MSSDAGLTSIRDALSSASDMTGDIEGFEVAYEGIAVGTYTLKSLQSSPESIAKDALATVAPFMN